MRKFKADSSPSLDKVEDKPYALRKRVKRIMSDNEEVDDTADSSPGPTNAVTIADVQNARDAINDAVSNLIAANVRFAEMSTAWLANPTHSRNPQLEEKLRLCKATIETLLD